MLEYSPAQIFCLQSLGYRRWFVRDDLRELVAARLADEELERTKPQDLGILRLKYREAEKLRARNKEREDLQASLAKLNPQAASEPSPAPLAAEKPLPILTGHACRFVLHPQISFVYQHENPQVWCLPALFCMDEELRLFADSREEHLLFSALADVGMTLSAQLLADACALRMKISDLGRIYSGILPQDLRSHLEKPNTQIICLLAKDNLSLLENLLAEAKDKIIFCTHPALALLSGKHKEQLWLDLLAIAGKL